MKRIASVWLLLLPVIACAGETTARSGGQRVLVVLGAAGSDEYAASFVQWAERWEAAAKKGGASCEVIGRTEAGIQSDKEVLQKSLDQCAAVQPERLWLVLVGHGTFDGKTARFNLRGPDFTPAELKQWLDPITCPMAVVDCSAASGPFLAELSKSERIVITATKSGHEYNFAHFGDFLSAAIADPAADLNKDAQTSLWEAYLAAGARLQEFYTAESRLATEHALLDDNADRLGTPAVWFEGLRPTKQTKTGAALDGALAAQFVLVPSEQEVQLPAEVRARRDELERRLAELRLGKADLPEADYLELIEPVLVELARLAAEQDAGN